MRRPAALLASTSVSQRLVLVLVLGAAGGAVLGHRAEALRPLADLLLLLLKAFAVPAVVVPAVVVSILHGLAGGSLRQLGGLGLRLVAAYGAIAVLATAIGAASAMLMLGGPRGGGGRLASESGRPPGAEERVFEKFYRGGSTQQGFGLGLPIAKAVVTAHGGTITAANRRPRGVAVRFELPRRRLNAVRSLAPRSGQIMCSPQTCDASLDTALPRVYWSSISPTRRT